MKLKLLQGARALLCPICWEEPFGLIAIEAMLTGTPVIGFRRGSFPEIVEHGTTGFLVDDEDEMADMLRELEGFDRLACAERARQRFSADRMAADYEALFVAESREPAIISACVAPVLPDLDLAAEV
jgi:glycosyltransferase involved in cell wall biosynthesis